VEPPNSRTEPAEATNRGREDGMRRERGGRRMTEGRGTGMREGRDGMTEGGDAKD